MSLSAEKLVAVLERRYDYHSARVVFRQVVARAGLSEGGPFTVAELDRFATALDAVGDRLGELLDQIRSAGGRGGHAAARAEPTPEPEPAPKPAPKAVPVDEAGSPPESARPVTDALSAEAAPAAEAPTTETGAKSEGREASHGAHGGGNQGKKKG
jgi:hypothetical protein